MKCAIAGCDHETSGKSKYCREHKQEARTRWIEMIKAKADEKECREMTYQEIMLKAIMAGQEAGQKHQPRPMVVQEHANAMNDSSPVVKEWFVSEGLCGFAWVIVKDRKFGNWLIKNGYGRRDSYAHGVNIWISEYSQSYERKQAHASAMADVFQKYGIKCYAGSRLD